MSFLYDSQRAPAFAASRRPASGTAAPRPAGAPRRPQPGAAAPDGGPQTGPHLPPPPGAQAGGCGSDGARRILDIPPERLHQRLPLFLGSPADIAELEGYGDVQQLRNPGYTV